MPDWLTYAQAGERFGVSAEAVRLRARRLGWRTQPCNDGRTLVLVPEDADVQETLFRSDLVVPSTLDFLRNVPPS